MVDCKRELENCNFVKAALMLLVVIYHSILFWGGNWFTGNPATSSTVLSWLAMWLNSFHIYAFALVSGYIFYYLKYEIYKYNSFTIFLKSKFKRLIVPYIFVTIVWLIPIRTIFWRFDAKVIFKNYFIGISPEQLWFLLMLFFVFLVSYPVSKLWKANEIIGIISILTIYGIGFVGNLILPNIFMIFSAFQYVLYFWIGFKIRQYSNSDNILIKFTRKIYPVWYFALHMVIFLIYNLFVTNSVMAVLCKPVLHVSGAIMAFVCLQQIANNKYINKSLDFFKKRSMSIYMFHQQVIYFIIYIFNGMLNPYVHSVLNFVLSLLVSIIIANVLMKFKCTRFLIGEK